MNINLFFLAAIRLITRFVLLPIFGVALLCSCGPTPNTPDQKNVGQPGANMSEVKHPIHANQITQTGPLGGTFLQMEYIWADPDSTDPDGLLTNMFRELRELNMDTVVIQSTREKKCANQIEDKPYRWWFDDTPDKVLHILNKAKEHAITVYVGLSMFAWWDCNNGQRKFFAAGAREQAVDDISTATKELVKKIGSHSQFGGWYLPDEPNLVSSPSEDRELLNQYFHAIVQNIRSIDSNSTRPIIVSPYLNGVNVSPGEVASRAKTFMDRTGVTVLAWQDSVGTAATNLSGRPGPSLDQYFYELNLVLGKPALWGVAELFEMGNKDQKMYTASAMRLNQQLSAMSTDFVGRRIAWINGTYMTRLTLPYGGTMPGAPRLFAAYKAMYGLGGNNILPASYFWLSAPSPSYPDNWKMFDAKVADSLNVLDKAWVGIPGWINGSAEVVLNFGMQKNIDWVAVHTGKFSNAGVAYPSKIEFNCFTSSHGWQTVGTQTLPIDKILDGEYTFSNLTPLNVSCQHLSVKMYGDAWIFVSEIEITGP